MADGYGTRLERLEGLVFSATPLSPSSVVMVSIVETIEGSEDLVAAIIRPGPSLKFGNPLG